MRFINKHVVRSVLQVKHSPLKVSLALLLFVLSLLWYDSLQVRYVPNDFSYSATILSTDNTYDRANGRYSGERYSQGTYFLQPTKIDGKTATVKGVLDVTSIDGESVGSASRQYTIYTASGQHARAKDHTASYLFAPRNLQEGQSFGYQHLLYEPTATMRYAGTETIAGVTTYRYSAEYPNDGRVMRQPLSRALSSAAVEYVPQIQIWFEPVTGWLVKYQEDTTAYGTPSGQQTPVPLSHFTSSFSGETVVQHIKYASDLKRQLAFGRQVVPGMLLVIGLMIAIVIVQRRLRIASVSVRLAAGSVLAASLAGLAGWLLRIQPLSALFVGEVPINPLTLASFGLLSMTVILLYEGRHTRVAVVMAVILVGLSSLHLSAAAGIIPFDVDLLILRDSVVEGGTLPSRMTLFGSLLFFVVGLGLVRTLLAPATSPLRFARLGAGMAVVLGMAAALSKIFMFDDGSLSLLVPTSLAVPLLFVIAGFAMLQALHIRFGREPSLRRTVHELGIATVGAMPLVLIGIVGQLQYSAVQQQLQATFEAHAQSVQRSVEDGVAEYTKMLSGAQALFAASQEVERDEWARYITALRIPEEYAGSDSTGFIRSLTPVQARQLTADVRARGYPDFSIFPAGDRSTYAPVVYAEPQHQASARMLGYDMFADPVRREAMLRARDTGRPTMSSALSLLNPAQAGRSWGFIVYLPVYANGMPAATVAERQQALQGFIYGMVDAEPFLASLVAAAPSELGISVYDGIQADATALLYRNSTASQLGDSPPTGLSKTATLYVANHPWTIRYDATRALRLSPIEESAPNAIIVLGSIIYLLIVLLFYTVKPLRARVVRMILRSDSEH